VALYSDRHGIFRVNAKDAQSGDGKTEFGRVAARLKIAPIHALTPQAKGRVERANQTLQDRLVKEMRLQNICSIEAANRFVPVFISFWNGKFAVTPRDKISASALAGHACGIGPRLGTPRGAGFVEGSDIQFGGHQVLRQDQRSRHRATRGESDAASLRWWRNEHPLQRPIARVYGLRDLPSP
jgi:hypothetical protein